MYLSRTRGALLKWCRFSRTPVPCASANMAAAPHGGSAFQNRAQSTQASSPRVVDLRSDTVTMPCRQMLETALSAPLGDDVMGEDPTVQKLEQHVAAVFGKERGLFVPTGTMSNLVALLAHCDTRASEIIAGAQSHICLWEGGNAANLGGISTTQVQEDQVTAEFNVQDIRDALRTGDDDHWPLTQVLCLENTQNMLGGVPLSKQYLDDIGRMAQDEWNIRTHVDGARIFHATVALDVTAQELCAKMDSISVCLSKGLGAPAGSVLVGNHDLIELAKRARKRCGGGMRQAGVIAAMGLYALENNIDRLREDHDKAKYLAGELLRHGFNVPRKVDTNIVYFGLPGGSSSAAQKEEFSAKAQKDFQVLITGGYSKGGELFRAVLHKDVDDAGVQRAVDAMVQCVP